MAELIAPTSAHRPIQGLQTVVNQSVSGHPEDRLCRYEFILIVHDSPICS
jgi:hypothetical protein